MAEPDLYDLVKKSMSRTSSSFDDLTDFLTTELTEIDVQLVAIKERTDRIPDNPPSETNLIDNTVNAAYIRKLFNDLTSVVNRLKLDVDKLRRNDR